MTKICSFGGYEKLLLLPPVEMLTYPQAVEIGLFLMLRKCKKKGKIKEKGNDCRLGRS